MRNALQSVLNQDIACEIVVIDEGSTDDTLAVVSETSPAAVVIHNSQPVGIIAARNQAFGVATGDIVFTLDDDAVMPDKGLIRSVLADFEIPFVGAITVPLVDHLPDGSTRRRIPERAPAADFRCAAQFSGGANAIRRDLFLRLGGYVGAGRQGEERGLCLRMLDTGMITKVADGFHIDHFPWSSTGQHRWLYYWSARNSVNYGWMYAPFPDVVAHTLGTWLVHGKATLGKKNFFQPHLGVIAGIGDACWNWRVRKPVSTRAFRAYRQICRKDILELGSLKKILERFQLRLHQETATESRAE